MVKGYDPTTNDPSKIVLEYLMRWMRSQNSLSLEQAQNYIKFWLKNSSYTSEIYRRFDSFESSNTTKPEIILKRKCSTLLDSSNWKLMYQTANSGDENYPAYLQDHKIVMCLNYLTNKTELKQNLDRQLTILWKKTNNQNQVKKQLVHKTKRQNSIKEMYDGVNSHQQEVQNRDKQLASILYEGCRQGYKNYMLQKQAEDRLSKKCAKYLFLRRSQRKLPWDIKFRYAGKIIEQLI